ncbi:MAG: DUF1127 domain-containing protein [Alphaproteobacteria bacterium]|nr:DUF1127 domain-containing protein [Alphaproteobacteria bacterium]
MVAGAAQSLAALPKKAIAAIGQWAAQRKAYEELMSLDDRQLRDMGLSRSEIPAVVAGNLMPDSFPNEVAPLAGETANANERPQAKLRRVA